MSYCLTGHITDSDGTCTTHLNPIRAKIRVGASTWGAADSVDRVRVCRKKKQAAKKRKLANFAAVRTGAKPDRGGCCTRFGESYEHLELAAIAIQHDHFWTGSPVHQGAGFRTSGTGF